jgi:hypothetical protein
LPAVEFLRLKPDISALLSDHCSLVTAYSFLQLSPRATFERSATVSPDGTKDLIDAPLAATGNADRKQTALFTLQVGSLDGRLRDLLRKHLSGCVRTIHFELSTAHGRLYRCRLFVGEKLGLARTTSQDQESNEREDYK